MSLFELCDQSEVIKRMKCLVCDKEFRTTKDWRTCGACKDNERDRGSRVYPKRSTK